MPDLDLPHSRLTPPLAQSTPVGFENMEAQTEFEEVVDGEASTEDRHCSDVVPGVECDDIGAEAVKDTVSQSSPDISKVGEGSSTKNDGTAASIEPANGEEPDFIAQRYMF